MKYEEVYPLLGDYSAYQVCTIVCFCIYGAVAIDALTVIFVAADMEHWCRVPELSRYSFERQKYIAVPTEGSETDSYSSCEMFDLNYTAFDDDDFRNWNRTEMIANQTDRKQCTEWVYDQTTFISTIVSRFNLVCDLHFLDELITTIYMLGFLCGVLSSGVVSDKYGRWTAMMASLLIRQAAMLVIIFSVNYPMFAVGRFFLGLGNSACGLSQLVLMMEVLSPRVRTKATVAVSIGYSVGYALLPLIAYFVRDDVMFQISVFAPNFLFLSYFIIIKESPRWLVVNGKHKRAMEVLEHICAVNGSTLPEDFHVKNIEIDDTPHQASCFDLYRTNKMRVKAIVMDFVWFTTSFVYFGLSLNTGTLSGNIYVNTALSGLLEIPAKLITTVLMESKTLGRRLTLCGAMLMCALANYCSIPLLLKGYGTAVTVISLIGKMCATGLFAAIYVYTAELYPTEIRHIGVATASMFARFGSMIAPFMGAPMIKIWKPLPSVLFGSCALLAGILCLLLPETLGRPLMDTVNEDNRNDAKSSTVEIKITNENNEEGRSQETRSQDARSQDAENEIKSTPLSNGSVIPNGRTKHNKDEIVLQDINQNEIQDLNRNEIQDLNRNIEIHDLNQNTNSADDSFIDSTYL